MKKLILSLIGLAGCATAQAQSSQSRFGLKAGLSLTNFVGKDVTSSSSTKTGFNGGLVAVLGLNDQFSIQPELLYSMKGVKDQASGSGSSITGYQTLHYVDVPVVVKARFSQLFIEAGPQVGILLEAKQTVEYNSMTSSTSNKASFNEVDFGYVLGLGFQADNGPMLGLRYNGGLTNIAKSQTFGGRSVQPEARNSAFQIYVGYLFGH